MQTQSTGADGAYRLALTTRTVGAEVEVAFDCEKLHKNGVSVTVEGEGVEASVDEAQGVVKVRATAGGKDAVVVLKGN